MEKLLFTTEMEILYDSSVSSNIEFENDFMNNKIIPKKVKDFVMNNLVDKIVHYKDNGTNNIYMELGNKKINLSIK